MAIINKGTAFSNGEQLTADKINNMLDLATFNASAVDNTSTFVNSSSQIVVADGGITKAKLATDALELAYPVGSIYMNAADATNPGTLFGFGTWATFGAGKVPVGIDSTDADFDVVGSGTNTNGTTGAKTHTLSIDEMPSHSHDYTLTEGQSNADGYDDNTTARSVTGTALTGTTGGNLPHNNLQPYIVVYMWKRTA